jgi:tetratricopeptide (TPR) repeat protein
MNVTRLLQLLCLTGTFASHCSFAAAVPGYPDNWAALDPREVAMLPKYCKYTQTYRQHVPGGSDRTQIDHWNAVMGPALRSDLHMFDAVHHYCNGLLQTNRALLLTRSAQWKKHYLSSSIGEFDYVIDRAPPTFRLLPEILTKKGENLARLDNASLAISTLEKAIELKRDYWPPYAALGDLYRDHGEIVKAREVLQKGLKEVPDSTALTRRLSELESAKPKPKAR